MVIGEMVSGNETSSYTFSLLTEYWFYAGPRDLVLQLSLKWDVTIYLNSRCGRVCGTCQKGSRRVNLSHSQVPFDLHIFLFLTCIYMAIGRKPLAEMEGHYIKSFQSLLIFSDGIWLCCPGRFWTPELKWAFCLSLLSSWNWSYVLPLPI